MFKIIANTFGTRIFNAIINLGIAVVVSNYLGTAGKGEQGIIITSVSILIIFTSIIGSASLSYHIPRFPLITLILPSYVWSFLVVALVYFLFISGIIPVGVHAIQVCSLSLILSITSVNQSCLIAWRKIKENNLTGLVQTLLTILMILLFFNVFGKKSIEGYIYSLYVAYSVTLVLSFYLIKNHFRNLTGKLSTEIWKSALKSMFKLGLYNQIAIFTQMLSFRVSYYFLDFFHGKSQVGIYSNGVSIAESIWLISRSIALVQLSEIINYKNIADSQTLTGKLNKTNFILAAVLLIPLLFIPSGLYNWMFGNGFADMKWVIVLISPGVLFFGIALIQGHYFSGTGKQYVNSIASTAGMLVTIALDLLVIPRFGYYGAALVSSVSYITTAMIVMIYYRKETGISIARQLPSVKDFMDLMIRIKNLIRHHKNEKNMENQ